MQTNIKDIHATWVCPKDEEYGLYRLREGSLDILDPGLCIRFSLKNIAGDEDDFEVTIRSGAKGFAMMLDYDSEPTTLPFTEYRSADSSFYIHESAQHRVYLTIDTAQAKQGSGSHSAALRASP